MITEVTCFICRKRKFIRKSQVDQDAPILCPREMIFLPMLTIRPPISPWMMLLRLRVNYFPFLFVWMIQIFHPYLEDCIWNSKKRPNATEIIKWFWISSFKWSSRSKGNFAFLSIFRQQMAALKLQWDMAPPLPLGHKASRTESTLGVGTKWLYDRGGTVPDAYEKLPGPS